jgi:thiaminase (transcriptional activator TenA)
MSLSEQFWDGSTDIYDAILAHPFLAGLADGSLPPDAFAFYIVQDSLYLKEYAKALAIVAGRAPDAATTAMFAAHAADAIAVEQDMHGELLADLGIEPRAVETAQPAPANLAYTSYLLATTLSGSFADGVAAVLPCYWIYWRVGRVLADRGSPDPRYQRWIDSYASEDFGSVVSDVLAATDRLELSPPERRVAINHFRTTSRYEWMFWDMGYRQQQWPV